MLGRKLLPIIVTHEELTFDLETHRKLRLAGSPPPRAT
jgi:hypothetical protein